MRLNRILMFFLVTFTFSWVLWIPVAMISAGFSFPAPLEAFLRSPYNPAAFGPTFAAVLLTSIYSGRAGLKSLLKKGVKWRFPLRWWILILFLFPALTALSLWLGSLWGDPLPQFYWLSNPIIIPVVFLYIFFLGGPLQEEFGWRGYALPRLQKKYAGIYAAILIGIVWGLWHIPLFFIQGTIQSQVPFWSFMILIVSASVVYTWVYNSTESILAVMIVHTTGNLSYFMFPVQGSMVGGIFLMIANITLALVVLLLAGKELETAV